VVFHHPAPHPAAAQDHPHPATDPEVFGSSVVLPGRGNEVVEGPAYSGHVGKYPDYPARKALGDSVVDPSGGFDRRLLRR